MAGWHHYRFRSSWALAASPDLVYAVLERAEEYPAWCPQVRAAEAEGEFSGSLRVRSFLPYDLRLAARATRRDPVARVLEIAMTGDLEGWAR